MKLGTKNSTWVVTIDLIILIFYGVAYIRCLKGNLMINEAILGKGAKKIEM